jgi:3'(2'), 5'-bisphosphate nucleotidase
LITGFDTLPLSPIQNQEQALCELAQAAGQAILQWYQWPTDEGVQLANKSDDSPLTRADLAAHDCIAQGLRRLTPDIPVVSEEDSASHAQRMQYPRHWLIDPLDGTREFLARNGQFTVNLALIESGVSVWGVVHAPVSGLTYWGGVGWGAWRQQAQLKTPIQATPQRDPAKPCRILASKSHLNDATRQFIDRVQPHVLLQAGSSLKFCQMAEGLADVYPRLSPTCEWDTAAAQAVLEGAGGAVLDLQGQPLRYGKADIYNPHFLACAPGWSHLLSDIST